MKNKNKISVKVFLTMVAFFTIPFAISTKTVLAADAFNYTLLESFPGFFNKGDTMTDFPVLILSIYKFGIWTVGIAGMFMLVIGGFMYMASAGNTSTAGSARKIISDALFGIVAALGAYLFMYVINPDLTGINIDFTTVDLSDVEDPQVSGTMSGSMVSRDGKQVDADFATALDKIKLAGTDAIVTSGLRSEGEQKNRLLIIVEDFILLKSALLQHAC